MHARRARKAKTRTNQKYLKCPEKTRELSEAREKTQAWSLHHSVAIDAEASDEERAVLEREMAIEKLIGITEKELRGASSRRYKGSKRG